MARLIEVQITPHGPTELTVGVGDVLQFSASGGRTRSGPIQMSGPYRSSVVGDNGEVLTPAGPPNVVLFLCGGQGRGTIEVVTGDPWRSPKTTVINIQIHK